MQKNHFLLLNKLKNTSSASDNCLNICSCADYPRARGGAAPRQAADRSCPAAPGGNVVVVERIWIHRGVLRLFVIGSHNPLDPPSGSSDLYWRHLYGVGKTGSTKDSKDSSGLAVRDLATLDLLHWMHQTVTGVTCMGLARTDPQGIQKTVADWL